MGVKTTNGDVKRFWSKFRTILYQIESKHVRQEKRCMKIVQMVSVVLKKIWFNTHTHIYIYIYIYLDSYPQTDLFRSVRTHQCG